MGIRDQIQKMRASGNGGRSPLGLSENAEREIEGRKVAHVGIVGDTIEERVVVTKITSGQGNHGPWHLTISETDAGDVIKWFSPNKAEYMEGDRLTIRGTVKKHDEYKGTKSTQFGRVKILSGFGSKVTP